jgi:hypothetical protein
MATVFTTPVRVTKLSSENSKPQPQLNSGTTDDTNPLKMNNEAIMMGGAQFDAYFYLSLPSIR